MTILGFNSTRSIVRELYKPGARSVCRIEQMPTEPLGSQIGFGGQGGIGVVASRTELTGRPELPCRFSCFVRPGAHTLTQGILHPSQVMLRLRPACSLDCKRALTAPGRNATSRTLRHDFHYGTMLNQQLTPCRLRNHSHSRS